MWVFFVTTADYRPTAICVFQWFSTNMAKCVAWRHTATIVMFCKTAGFSCHHCGLVWMNPQCGGPSRFSSVCVLDGRSLNGLGGKPAALQREPIKRLSNLAWRQHTAAQSLQNSAGFRSVTCFFFVIFNFLVNLQLICVGNSLSVRQAVTGKCVWSNLQLHHKQQMLYAGT